MRIKKNGGAFDENVIPELTQLAQENEDFSGKSNKLNGAIQCRELRGRWEQCSDRHQACH